MPKPHKGDAHQIPSFDFVAVSSPVAESADAELRLLCGLVHRNASLTADGRRHVPRLGLQALGQRVERLGTCRGSLLHPAAEGFNNNIKIVIIIVKISQYVTVAHNYLMSLPGNILFVLKQRTGSSESGRHHEIR